MNEAAPAPPAPVPAFALSKSGLRVRLAALALCGAAFLAVAFEHLFVPTRRDPRLMVVMIPPLFGLAYCLLSLGRHAIGGPLRSGLWRLVMVPLAAASALVGPPVVEQLAVWLETRAVNAAVEPFLEAVREEQQRTGRPPLDIEPLVRRHLAGVSPERHYRVRHMFHYFAGPQQFALAIGAVPGDRDNDAYLVYDGSRDTWFQRELFGLPDDLRREFADRVPFLPGTQMVNCFVQPEKGWTCHSFGALPTSSTSPVGEPPPSPPAPATQGSPTP